MHGCVRSSASRTSATRRPRARRRTQGRQNDGALDRGFGSSGLFLARARGRATWLVYVLVATVQACRARARLREVVEHLATVQACSVSYVCICMRNVAPPAVIDRRRVE